MKIYHKTNDNVHFPIIFTAQIDKEYLFYTSFVGDRECEGVFSIIIILIIIIIIIIIIIFFTITFNVTVSNKTLILGDLY